MTHQTQAPERPSDYLGVKTTTRDCPECHEQCGWCSMYRWIVRQHGCMDQGKKSCRMSKQVKGSACGTCDGSRRVTVRSEILVVAS